jgi:hypothetical protein
MNPIKQMIGTNPKQFLLEQIMQNNSNPMINNLLAMAKNGDTKGVETFARNFMQERGVDFDKEFANFMQNWKR